MSLDILIDTSDLKDVLEYKYKWALAYHKSINGYYVKATEYVGTFDGKPKYKPVLLHRFIMRNEIDESIHVDHQNNNTLDNRRSNFRLTDNASNIKNRSSKNRNNKSGYRNVCWEKSSERWIVQIQVNKKNKVLGWFKDVHEAGKFAEEMRKEHYGEFAGNS